MSRGPTTAEGPIHAHQDPIARLGPWFHNLHLPGGRQTRPDHPYGDFPSMKWELLGPALPDDLTGRTALDIGCNAGFYSFELARRGADVTAVDVDDHYLDQARWAAGELGLERRVRFERRSVYGLRHLDRRYDLVLFMGVFYHLRYPTLGLDLAAGLVADDGTFVFQALTMPGEEVARVPEDTSLGERQRMLEPGWPKLAFIERRLEGDPTNWWAPNHAAIEAMLRTCGLSVRGRPGHEIYVCARGEQDPLTASMVEDELRQVFEEAR